jgi:hypothetical protein
MIEYNKDDILEEKTENNYDKEKEIFYIKKSILLKSFVEKINVIINIK